MKLLNFRYALIAGAVVALVGCGSDSDNAPANGQSADLRYEVQLTNLTGGQSFSDPLLVMHPASEQLWQTGQSASTALEELVESGSNTAIASLASDSSSGMTSGASTVSPGGTQTLTITSAGAGNTSLTILTRLQQTNDGFTGANAIDLSVLTESGQSISMDRWALDAGTEENLEGSNVGTLDTARPTGSDGTSGSEFNHVSVHPGVLTEVSPVSGNTSQLEPSRKFDNPVVRIRITRLEG